VIRAIIFDFDGVLANTEHLHYQAAAAVLAEQGISLSEEHYFAEYLGYDDRGLFLAALSQAGKEPDERMVAGLVEAKGRRYMDLIRGNRVLIDGVSATVNCLAARWPLAICSCARREEIEAILADADLLGRFAIIVAAGDFARPKPDPECYNIALQRLRVLPALRATNPLRAAECLVIEDSVPGIRAAKAAGMKVVAVTTSHPRERLTEAQAVFDSVAALDPNCVLALGSAGSTE